MTIVLRRTFQVNVIIFTVIHLSHSLFERCDETYYLDSSDNVTISSLTTLNSKNVSSCRYLLIAPVNYVVKVACKLRFDQANPSFCPTKRFFVSADGVHSLHRAQNFCNKNGTARIIRRRSVMNRLVMAYVSKRDLNDERFTCTASRVKIQCDCGWSRRVSQSWLDIVNILVNVLCFFFRREFTTAKMHKCTNFHRWLHSSLSRWIRCFAVAW